MAHDWSRTEVEAAVADYLEMLIAERAGLPYNKSEHRRALLQKLDGRTDASIERKHQNISAALLEVGVPYIEGYKPLRNFQQLLFDVVASQVDQHSLLRTTLTVEASQPASVPTVDDILDTLVSPPRGDRRQYERAVRSSPRLRRGVDYLAMEVANRSLGDAGEQFVLHFEQARLAAAGAERLASKIERVSVTRGDGAGFDILSFDEDSRERLIEVKTTGYGPATPFFVTRNELSVSRESAMRYHLYRVFDFRRNPRIFSKPGQVDQAFLLDPVQYLARVRED